MIAWSRSQIRPCSWCRMVVFDGKIRRAGHRTCDSQRPKACQQGQSSTEHSRRLQRSHASGSPHDAIFKEGGTRGWSNELPRATAMGATHHNIAVPAFFEAVWFDLAWQTKLTTIEDVMLARFAGELPFWMKLRELRKINNTARSH